MKRAGLAWAEAQGKHKEESAVGTTVSQPWRWHPSSVHGGGFGSLRQDFGLWEGPAALRIRESGDSRGKELSLTAESGGQHQDLGAQDPQGWAGWHWPSQEPPSAFLLSVSAPEQAAQSPRQDIIAGDNPAWPQHVRMMCNLPFPDWRILLKNFPLIYLRQCYCNLYWAEILRELNEDFISWL